MEGPTRVPGSGFQKLTGSVESPGGDGSRLLPFLLLLFFQL